MKSKETGSGSYEAHINGILDMPWHTMCHNCLFAQTERPALFSGDTLFNAGAGNTHNGGDTNVLYDTFVRQLTRLHSNTHHIPDTTTLSPISNLRSPVHLITLQLSRC